MNQTPHWNDHLAVPIGERVFYLVERGEIFDLRNERFRSGPSTDYAFTRSPGTVFPMEFHTSYEDMFAAGDHITDYFALIARKFIDICPDGFMYLMRRDWDWVGTGEIDRARHCLRHRWYVSDESAAVLLKIAFS